MPAERSEGVGQEKDTGNSSAAAKHDAGCFSSWLRRFRFSLITDGGNNVPCGECTACCTSSYFIHIRPEEMETLSRINKRLLFPAPGLPKGNKLLGYFGNGACPLLSDNGCMIYSDRPKTCRNYDCRIFASTGIDAGGTEKELVNRQVRRWCFTYPTAHDRLLQRAVVDAAIFMEKYRNSFPSEFVPKNPSLLAVAALRVYRAFISRPYEKNKQLPQKVIREYVRAVTEENDRLNVTTHSIQKKRSVKTGPERSRRANTV